MNARTRRVHLAYCANCGGRIAWSRKRQHWLSLAPLFAPNLRHIARRLMCPKAPRSGFHDPQLSVIDMHL